MSNIRELLQGRFNREAWDILAKAAIIRLEHIKKLGTIKAIAVEDFYDADNKFVQVFVGNLIDDVEAGFLHFENDPTDFEPKTDDDVSFEEVEEVGGELADYLREQHGYYFAIECSEYWIGKIDMFVYEDIELS